MIRAGQHALKVVLLTAAGLVRLAASPAETRGEEPGLPDFAASLANLNNFDQAAPMAYAAFRRSPPEDWYRILSAMHNLLVQHQGHFRSLDRRAQAAVIVRLGDFLLRKRKEKSADRLMGPGRKVLAIFRENDHFESRRREGRAGIRRGLEFFRAAPPGGTAAIKESFEHGGTPAEVKTAFWRRVAEIVREGKPATIVVWSHGSSTAFDVSDQVCISSRELADAMLSAGCGGREPKADLSRTDLMFIFCCSADYSCDLLARLQQSARESRTRLVLPNSITASCARRRKSIGIVFWHGLSEYYVRLKLAGTQRPVLDLGAILGFVDRNIYTFGRKPVFDAQSRIIAWRVVDPELLQNPTVVVPLDDADRRELRQLLQLPKETALPSCLQIGMRLRRVAKLSNLPV